MDIIGSYKKMVVSLLPDNLKKQLASEKGSLMEGVKYLLLGSLVVVFFQLIGLAIGALLSGGSIAGSGRAMPFFAAGTGVSLLVQFAIILLIPLMLILLSLLGTAIMWALAKVLGGQGSFTDQFYHFSPVNGGVMVISSIVSLVPCVGQLVGLVVSLYYLYPTYLIYKEVHKLSTGKAIALVLLPFLLLVLVVVAMFFMAAAFLATIFSGMMTGRVS